MTFPEQTSHKPSHLHSLFRISQHHFRFLCGLFSVYLYLTRCQRCVYSLQWLHWMHFVCDLSTCKHDNRQSSAAVTLPPSFYLSLSSHFCLYFSHLNFRNEKWTNVKAMLFCVISSDCGVNICRTTQISLFCCTRCIWQRSDSAHIRLQSFAAFLDFFHPMFCLRIAEARHVDQTSVLMLLKIGLCWCEDESFVFDHNRVERKKKRM